jgi:hypothetical protein
MQADPDKLARVFRNVMQISRVGAELLARRTLFSCSRIAL